MVDTILAQLNIGLFYNIFVCIILGILSFIVAHKVTPRFAEENNHPTFYRKYLRYFWMYSGFTWLLTAIRLIFNWRGDFGLDKFSFYIIIILLTVASLFLLLYSFSTLFHRYKFSTIIVFISAVLAGIFLFFCLIEGVQIGESSFWNRSWLITTLTKNIYLYVIFFVAIGSLSLVFLRELVYLVLDKFEYYDGRHIFTAAGIILYITLFVPDFFGVITGWNVVLLRSLLLIPIFLIYYIYTGESVVASDLYSQDLTFAQRIFKRRPLLFKAIVLIIFVSIIPLLLASILLIYLFRSVFVNLPSTEQLMLTQHVQGQIIIIALVIGILTFFMGISWARAVVMRLRLLYNGTQEIAQGNFDYYIEELGSRDEIRLLGYLFNKLSTYLREYKEEVIESSQSLENKVGERTLELERKNKELHVLAEEHERILHQLEARSDIIFENMGDGLLLLDEQLTIIYANKLLIKRFGISVTSLENQSLYTIKELARYDELIKGIEKVQLEKMDDFEFKFSLVAPLLGEVECRISPIILRSGDPGLMILMHDISPPWGVVRDAQTLEPIKLAMVRLIDEKTQRVIDTEVTDPSGRFGFFVAPGRYYVSVMKDGYHFPPKNAQGYKGEVIDIKSRDEGAIKFNIFMDKLVEQDDGFGFDEDATQSIQKVSSSDSGEKLATVEELESQQSSIGE